MAFLAGPQSLHNLCYYHMSCTLVYFTFAVVPYHKSLMGSVLHNYFTCDLILFLVIINLKLVAFNFLTLVVVVAREPVI